MSANSNDPSWAATAVLVARLIFAALFIMAVSFKLVDINATAAQIASVGFPVPQVLAWLAVVFELALIASFVTGLYFTPAALLAALTGSYRVGFAVFGSLSLIAGCRLLFWSRR